MTIGIGVGIVGGVVMLCVVGVIIFIEGCPSWIIAIGEGSMGGVEFVGKYERVDAFSFMILITLGLLVGRGSRCSNHIQWHDGHCVGWSVGIDPAGVTNEANASDAAADEDEK